MTKISRIRLVITNNRFMFSSLFFAVVLLCVFIFSTFYYANRNNSLHEESASRYHELIRSAAGFSIIAGDDVDLPGKLAPFCSEREIGYLKVTDQEGRGIFECGENSHVAYHSREPFAIESSVLAWIELGIIDVNLLNKIDKLSNSILRSNLADLWNYNISSIRTNTDFYFRDKDAAEITIKDAKGYVIARRTRTFPEETLVSVRKQFRFNDRPLGELILTLSNANTRKHRQTVLTLSRISIFVCLALIIYIPFVIMRINANYRNTYSRFRAKPLQPGFMRSPAALQNSTIDGSWKMSGSTEKKIRDAISYIHNNYDREISREGLAELVQINADNLGRYFKLLTGEKLMDYINRLRIEKAASEIVNSDKTIIHIAYECGFENTSTFYRLFSKFMKISPMDFRRFHESHQPSDTGSEKGA